MKISIVASSIVPGNSLGIEHFTYRLLSALFERYPEHEYFVLIPAGTLDVWRSRVLRGDNVSFVPIRFSPTIRSAQSTAQPGISDPVYAFFRNQRIFRFLFRKLKLFELRRVLNQLRPDIVYSPAHVEPLVFGTWGTVISVHDLREIMREFHEEDRAASLITNISKSQGVVVAWQHPYNQLVQTFPLHKSKTHLIPFPIPIARSGNNMQPAVDSSREIILFASALRAQKNHINLLKAMPEIINARSREKKQVMLICAGTCHSPLIEELRKEVSRLGIEENVRFTGFISDAELEKLYEAATMIVAPTLWEAASGAVFEAFSFEKPVACSNIPPIRSQVEQARGMVNYFDPGEPKDIARSVLEVLENPGPYVDGAKRGAEFVCSLTWSKTAQQYMQIFNQVAESRRVWR